MDFISWLVEAGAFSYASYTFYRWQDKQTKLNQLIKFLKSANALSPNHLTKAMDGKSSPYLLNSVLGFEEGKNYSRGLALVQGVVDSEQVIRSILNHSTKLVLSSVSSELIFSNNRNFEEADGRIDTKFVSEFKLTDPASVKDNIILSTTSNVKYSDALHLIHSIVHMRSLSPLEKFLSWILFCIKLFLSMSNVGKRLSGFKVGTKRVERGIMIGQYMVAFGEVIFDKFNKELRMTNPRYFLKDKDQLIYKLKDKNSTIKKNLTLLLTLIAVLGFLLTKRSIKIFRLFWNKYQRLREAQSPDKFARLRKIFMSSFKCSSCGENVRNAIFKPCLHLVLCTICYEKMTEKNCPSCNQEIEEAVNVFVV
jgi:hypothetical protein